MRVHVDDAVRARWAPGPFLTICRFEGCPNVLGDESGFVRECDAALADLRSRGKAVLEEPRFQQMKATFRAMPDMDPSRYRPASEALARRLLERDFFRISPLVDVNNLVSVRLRIPLGIYDLDRVDEDCWNYRLGRAGEEYESISSQTKNADGKLVLSDGRGIFGSPVTDSARSAVSPSTTRVAVVAFLPMGLTEEVSQEVTGLVDQTFLTYFRPQHQDSSVVSV